MFLRFKALIFEEEKLGKVIKNLSPVAVFFHSNIITVFYVQKKKWCKTVTIRYQTNWRSQINTLVWNTFGNDYICEDQSKTNLVRFL